METVKSTRIFNLPWGFMDQSGSIHSEAEVREMTGEDEDILGNTQIPIASRMDKLLARCTIRIGTITEEKQIFQAIRKLPAPDRLRLLIGIRVATFDPNYHFKVRCSECSQEGSYSVDLTTMTVTYPEDRALRSFPVALPSGGKARFKVLTGEDESRLSQVRQSKQDMLSLALMARLEDLNGKPPTLADVKKLTARDRQFLRKEFEKADFGVDTSIDVTCVNCSKEFKTEIDLGQSGFFFPEPEPEQDGE